MTTTARYNALSFAMDKARSRGVHVEAKDIVRDAERFYKFLILGLPPVNHSTQVRWSEPPPLLGSDAMDPGFAGDHGFANNAK